MSKHFKFFKFNSRKYDPVLDQEEGSTSDYKDSTGLSADQVPSLQVATSRKPNLLYISTFVFAALAIFLFAQNVQLRRRGSFHTGYKNELALATPAILVSEVKFTGGIKFHDNGSMYRDHGPGPQFVGRPSPELDAAWDELTGTRYLAFTDKQKSSINVDMDRSAEDGLYRAGPDVLHSLHCVDKLRRTIDGYLYQLPELVDESRQNVFHVEHCLDFLRQLVQCTSDLTPIPLVYSKGAGFPIPDFEQVHTCRSFGPILEWALKQNEDALSTVDIP